MAEQHVAIDGLVSVTGTVGTTPSGTQNVAVTGQPLNVVDVLATGNYYLYAVADVPGTAGAINYLSLFNPLASGKTLTIYRVIANSYATGVTSSAISAELFRTTAASAGTLATASAVPRLDTATANPVAEVRSGNPTVTTLPTPILNFPPPLTASKGGGMAQESIIPSGGFVCHPGEGLVVRQSASETAQIWGVQFLWSET